MTPMTPVAQAIDAALATVIAAGPAAGAQPLGRLRALFRDLARARPSRDPDAIEDLIWAHWIDHADPQAAAMMSEAIEAMVERRLDAAGTLLDRLVMIHPDWAEAWNKRATLRFIEGRDAEAVADVARTLALEPRHFGALSGFGQICLRNGALPEAKAAFMIALAINPHLIGIAEAIAEIDAASAGRH
ncbi:MAG: hypothetical protein ACK50Q_02140 [Labrys sp. (in: a-proteobacteria)]